MSIELWRVDNRLIHGQVLEAWVPRVRAQAILVVDDSASSDPFQKCVLEAMGQCVIQVSVKPPREAVSGLKELGAKRVIVLFRTVPQALMAMEAGLPLETLNLGNVHPTEDSVRLTPSVNLSPEDIAALRRMLELGVKADARSIPTEDGPDVAGFLKVAGAA